MPCFTIETESYINLDDLVESLIGLDIGQQAIMGSFSYLGLTVSKASYHVLEQFCPDVVFYISGVKVNDFDGKGAG